MSVIVRDLLEIDISCLGWVLARSYEL